MIVPSGQFVATSFGPLLRRWRLARRVSQLALAGDTEISPRHLSFLETSRARPSREMIQRLTAVLEVSLYDQNEFFLAGGYAPLYGQRPLDASEFEHVRRALEFILTQQEPYPAIVIDAQWNVRMRNAASTRLLGPFQNASVLSADRAQNVMHVVCHPKAMRQYIVNWEEFVGPLFQMIHREAETNMATARLRDELLIYSDLPRSWRAPDPPATASPLLTMQLKKDDLQLSFFSTLTTFAMPRDVTLQQLRIECFYPADSATERIARQLAVQS